MTSKTITFQLKVGNVGQVLDRVVFRSEDGTWGVRRMNPDHDIKVAADTPLVPEAAGSTEYAYTINNLTAGEDHEYRIEYDFGGDTDSIYRVFTAPLDPAVVPTSPYTTWERFLRRFGKKNIAEASNKENKNAEPDTSSVQDAFDYAVDEIHDVLRGGVLAVPLDFTPWAGRVPRSLGEVNDIIAFCWLYDSRGWPEKNSTRNKMEPLLKRAYLTLQAFRSGLLQLEASQAVETAGEAVTGAGEAIFKPALTRYIDGDWIFV